MKLSIITLTSYGVELAKRLHSIYPGSNIYTTHKQLERLKTDSDHNTYHPIIPSLKGLTKLLFESERILVFIMATGIVVRTIAPFLVHKSKDPAVLVIDEKGQFVISLLSGHLGNANQYATEIATSIQAIPVITTSSDLNQVTAVDLFAREIGCYLSDYKAAKLVTSCLIENEPVGIWSDLDAYQEFATVVRDPKGIIAISYQKPSLNDILESDSVRTEIPVVWLIPRRTVVGIGCRRDKSMEEIRTAVELACNQIQRPLGSIAKLVSIDVKADEYGIQEFAKALDVDFICYPAEQLKKVEHLFDNSEFVKKTVGVGNVSESAGYIGSDQGRCLLSVQKTDGITVSLWEMKDINGIDEGSK